jgi:hypothetical protein
VILVLCIIEEFIGFRLLLFLSKPFYFTCWNLLHKLLSLISIEIYKDCILRLISYLGWEHISWVALIIGFVAALTSILIWSLFYHFLFAVVLWTCNIKDLFIIPYKTCVTANDKLVGQESTTSIWLSSTIYWINHFRNKSMITVLICGLALAIMLLLFSIYIPDAFIRNTFVPIHKLIMSLF